MSSQHAKLTVHSTKKSIPTTLHELIHQSFLKAMDSNPTSTFHVALSGGSLPSFLAALPQSFVDAGIDPQWDKWHVLLADERLVPSTHKDSNLGAIKGSFLQGVPIPTHQVYGIDEHLLGEDPDDQSSIPNAESIAQDYQSRVFDPLLANHDGTSSLIDCALLGFGPDGHTCSLFPSHELINESELLVASIEDSPKPPPKRITLTMKTLNQFTRDVIFVGAGESKAEILNDILQNIVFDNNSTCTVDGGDNTETIQQFSVIMNAETTYPCGMIKPVSDSLHYITDESATNKLQTHSKSSSCLCFRSSM